jgi:phage baseplate assembly protein W
MRSQQISDLNTNNPSIVAKKFLFSDLDSTFTRNPFTGDLYLKKDIEAVKKAIVNIVLTGNFERPFQPRFGANIREYLFELLDENVIDTIQTVIINAIETYEPRAKVRDIRINEDTQDSNKISVSIEFAMVSTGKIADVTTVLERVR